MHSSLHCEDGNDVEWGSTADSIASSIVIGLIVLPLSSPVTMPLRNAGVAGSLPVLLTKYALFSMATVFPLIKTRRVPLVIFEAWVKLAEGMGTGPAGGGGGLNTDIQKTRRSLAGYFTVIGVNVSCHKGISFC